MSESVIITKVDHNFNSKNIYFSGMEFHPTVFFVSTFLTITLVIITLAFPDDAAIFFANMLEIVTSNFNWLMASLANLFVAVCLIIMISPYGKIRLGGAGAKPDFGYVAWFSMLFAAGMGVGLVFFGVSEPITHFTSSLATDAGQASSYAPLGGAIGDIAESKRLGMAATVFHWTLHPWATFVLVALSLALSSYNSGLPLTIRSGFYPIFGDLVWGPLGSAIDTLAVLATVFGLATSLGLGAQQALSGFNFLFGIEYNIGNQVLVIFGVALVTVCSLYLGLRRGVRRLSEINLILAAVLCLFIVIAGPTILILTDFTKNLVAYIQELPALSNPVGRKDQPFFNQWTIFYWAWWASWAPFVGMFIARISRGRSVREFIFYVLLIPSVISTFWITTFGSVAIDQIVSQGHTALANADLPIKLFVMLEQLPLAGITSFIGIILVLVFFITSWDSGSLVLDTISAGGKIGTMKTQRVLWVGIVGFVAIALLVGGGLKSLQSASIITGLPFMIVIAILIIGILKSLSQASEQFSETDE